MIVSRANSWQIIDIDESLDLRSGLAGSEDIGIAGPWIIACVNRFREVYEANGRGDKLDPLHFDPRMKPPYSILPRLVP